MLKIIRNPEFRTTVRVHAPADGGQQDGEFSVRFRALTRSGLAEFDLGDVAGTDDFLRTVVLGWDGLVGDAGERFEFSDDNFSLLLDLTYVRVALVRAYFDATGGVRAAKRGN